MGASEDGRPLGVALGAFVVLGVSLRVARYLLDYPLWWDEAFLSVNFIRRGYADLLRPLDYGQVCPILFLAAELTAVKLLGFSEWTLRLFPLACACGSVALFRVAAGRVLRGVPLLLAVGIFAASYHPIRHSADVKPYASDLLAALTLLAPALGWLRDRGRAGPLWGLAAVAPVAVSLSHPSIFVAAGLALALAPTVAWAGRSARAAYATFVVGAGGTFLALYAVFTRPQAAATLANMQAQWGAAFPPLGNPWAFLKWFVAVHTGGMLAYPCGGEDGASAATLLLCVAGGVALWRRGRRAQLGVCLAPFGVALAAAALRRYPYGGVAHGSPARVMQYLAPGICLLAGLGAGSLLGFVAAPRRRLRLLIAGLLGLVAVGVVPLAREAAHPYRSVHSQRARAFARRFWPGFVRGAEPVCLRRDLGLTDWSSSDLNVAVYLCNQEIYSPRRRNGEGPRWGAVSADRPLRCINPLARPGDDRADRWLDAMQAIYQLRGSRSIVVNMAEPGAAPRLEHHVVYEFVPRAGG